VDETKSDVSMATKLDKITNLSYRDKRIEFDKLMPHFNFENLVSCFNELDGTKAVGIDGRTKQDYAEDLDVNIQNLIDKMKCFKYRPQPIREVLIPKGNGKLRPLGISNIEEKIVQLMFSKILEAIYEPLFCECSYGFRRNRNAHGAIRDAIEYLKFNNVKRVIDVDLENFFGTIRHKDMMRMLSLKIKDKIFLRYISRLLKACKYTPQGIERSDIGLLQGSILSPVLANIYAHYVIDLWFEKEVTKHTIGKVKIFRFCDDFIVCCTDTRDINRVTRSLHKRLEKFGLKLNMEKTKLVKFNRYDFERGIKQESFDFLGFTLYLSKARKGGFTTIKAKTSKKTMRTKLANAKLWLQQNRFRGGLRDLWLEYCRKLKGHIAYFGVANNGRTVRTYLQQARRLFLKWMNRRSQKRSISWEMFAIFERQYPLPRVRIYHNLYTNCKS
jgi:group II intron reverse transcriptase/maturase